MVAKSMGKQKIVSTIHTRNCLNPRKYNVLSEEHFLLFHPSVGVMIKGTNIIFVNGDNFNLFILAQIIFVERAHRQPEHSSCKVCGASCVVGVFLVVFMDGIFWWAFLKEIWSLLCPQGKLNLSHLSPDHTTITSKTFLPCVS